MVGYASLFTCYLRLIYLQDDDSINTIQRNHATRTKPVRYLEMELVPMTYTAVPTSKAPTNKSLPKCIGARRRLIFSATSVKIWNKKMELK